MESNLTTEKWSNKLFVLKVGCTMTIKVQLYSDLIIDLFRSKNVREGLYYMYMGWLHIEIVSRKVKQIHDLFDNHLVFYFLFLYLC